MKRVASPGLMHDTGCLGLVHWDENKYFCSQSNVLDKKLGHLSHQNPFPTSSPQPRCQIPLCRDLG